MQLYDVHRGLFRDGGHGGGIFDGTISGLGQALTMSADRQALLKSCQDTCDGRLGLPSGHPDWVALSACFANCNTRYPPTITGFALPAEQTSTATPATAPASAAGPTLMPMRTTAASRANLPANNYVATTLVPAPMPETGMSAGMKLALAVGGVALVGGVGYAVYKGKKKKMTPNRRRRARRAR